MVGKMKTTRYRKIFVLQVFARNFAKIEDLKSQKDDKIGSEALQRYREKFKPHIYDKSTPICVKI